MSKVSGGSPSVKSKTVYWVNILTLLLFTTTAAADTWTTFRGNPPLTGVAPYQQAPPQKHH